MRSYVVGLGALLAITAASTPPLLAQGAVQHPLPPGCTRITDRPAKRPRPAEARKDSLRGSIRQRVEADLRESARSGGVTDPRGMMIVSTDPHRTEVEARMFRSNLPDSIASAVAARALPGLRDWPDSGPAHLFIRLDSLPTPPDTTYECRPDVLDRRAVSDRMLEYVRSVMSRGRTQPGTFGNQVRMVVTREGEVADVVLARPSGSVQMDSYVLLIAPMVRFRPAVVKGVPVDSYVTLPFTAVVPPDPMMRRP